MRKQAGDEHQFSQDNTTTYEAMFTRAFSGTWTRGAENTYTVTYTNKAHFDSMSAFLNNTLIPNSAHEDEAKKEWSLSITGTAPTILNVYAQTVDSKTFHDPAPNNWQATTVKWPERQPDQSAIDYLHDVNLARGISAQQYHEQIMNPDLSRQHDKLAIYDFLNTLKLRESDNSWGFDRETQQFKLAIPAAAVDATLERAVAKGFKREDLQLRDQNWGKELLLSAKAVVSHHTYIANRVKYDAASLHNAEHGVPR